MRILTRLWSEDSSTPVSLESRNQPKKGKTKARPTKQTTTRKGQKQHKPKKQGGEGASVEKPDTSLARQFKHLNRRQVESKITQHSRN